MTCAVLTSKLLKLSNGAILNLSAKSIFFQVQLNSLISEHSKTNSCHIKAVETTQSYLVLCLALNFHKMDSWQLCIAVA
jgi:hypothetical protein